MQTVADLYESMKANIQAQHDQAYQAQKETAIFDKILADSDVEIDDSELQKALEKHIQHISMQLAQQGMQLEQYLQMMGVDETAFRQQIEPSAKQQAIFEAIIDEIINVENIETSDEEVDQQVESIASYNKDVYKRQPKDSMIINLFEKYSEISDFTECKESLKRKAEDLFTYGYTR